MQTGILDSGTNYNSQDKNNMPSISINEIIAKIRKTLRKNPLSKFRSRTFTCQPKGNQTSYTNREISDKKKLFIESLHNDTTEEDLSKLFSLRSTQCLKQICWVKVKDLHL